MPEIHLKLQLLLTLSETYQHILRFNVLVDDNGIVVVHILDCCSNFCGDKRHLLCCELYMKRITNSCTAKMF